MRGPDDVIAFAAQHGYPVAIKAALGGGGRGLKVARSAAEVPALLDSAMREAAAAFGSDICFAERYLDRARHVEAQVLADSYGNVVVAGTRDCTLQRRHQKLLEEAPAPFLTSEQRAVIHESARAICREAGYQGAGTVEYLVAPDGTITFLEVNTRLQVEHPVTEETTGVDLVREQFRIAAGERLSLDGDPQPHGHAIEFRINGEDPGRGFLPAPGAITRFDLPHGPGVRIDTGVEPGSVVGGQFDSLLAKLIVTGRDRQHALERARRALAEMAVDGVATVLPFHRAVVTDPAFTGNRHGFGVHTRWIETEFQADIPPYAPSAHAGDGNLVAVVTVGGRPLHVSLPAGAAVIVASGAASRRAGGPAATAGDVVRSPMQGVVVNIAAEPGRQVEPGDLLMVLEAMKMENPVTAHKSGMVTALAVSPGQPVSQGTVLCEIKD